MENKQRFTLTIREIIASRYQFERAPESKETVLELPLREKQALIDEIMRGMPIKQLDVYAITNPGRKTRYRVVKGWNHLQAILDFYDGKFSTWTLAEKQEWEREHS